MKQTLAICLTVLLIFGEAGWLAFQELSLRSSIQQSLAFERFARYKLDEKRFEADVTIAIFMAKQHVRDEEASSILIPDATPTPEPSPSPSATPTGTTLRADNDAHATPTPPSPPDPDGNA